MKQKIKKNMPTNAFIIPSEQIVNDITQDILDVQDCLNTKYSDNKKSCQI